MASFDSFPVLRELLPAVSIRQIEPLEGAGGFSGSQLWRVTITHAIGQGASRQFCLRRWPANTSADRLHFIHQVLTHVATQGIAFIPVPVPRLVTHGGHFWDLAPWLWGLADFHARPTRNRLAAAMQALARFHSASATFSGAASRLTFQPAPAFVERLTLAQQFVTDDLDRCNAAVHAGLTPELDDRASRILSCAGDRLTPILTHLQPAAACRLSLCPAIRDIHHDHVLFTGDQVTGIIDFGAMRIDTPLADIARLVGSLVRDDGPLRAFALDQYSQLRPLSAQDRTLIDLLDESGLMLGSLNWLVWLYVERRDMGPLPPILKRLNELLARLENPGQ